MTTQPGSGRKRRPVLKVLGAIIFLAAAGYIVLRATFIDIKVTPSEAMAPALRAGDQFVVW